MSRGVGRLLFRIIPLWSWRLCFYGTVAALLLAGGAVLGLRYWVLPNIESYRGELETALSRATGQRIAIGQITADWQGWRPHISLGEVTVHDAAGRAALSLERIDQTLSWLSLLFLEPRFYSLEIRQPELTVRRLEDGRLSVAGIELGKTQGGGGLSDWLLRQREVIVRGANITWIDEKLQAPELPLTQVTLRLQNDFHRHRFGLRAIAPEHLAGPLDVRGDFQGGSVKATREWEGRLFAQLDYADFAAWRPWIPLPIAIDRGTGALRLWLDIDDDRVTGVIADVRLSGLRTQLARDLDALELGALSGRVGWRGWKQGYELFAQQLVLQAGEGPPLPQAELRLRRTYARADKPSSGELNANALELEPLARIADRLPLDAGLRAAIARHAPAGSVHGLAAKWSGDWPPARFDVKAGFSNIGIRETDALPGVSSLSGTIEANETRGTLRIANQGTTIELQNVFAQPLELAELSGQVGWAVANGEYDVRIAALSFANADVAGTLQGSYRTSGAGRGVTDLTGALTRADARQIAKYLPLRIGRSTRDWVARSVLGGHSNDVKLRLQGDLKDFPFEHPGRGGIFEVKVRAKDGILDYANGWPRIENIDADLTFSGQRMEIRVPSASVLGAQLARVTAVIADLNHASELLEVSGEAEAPTADFLRFIGESPVAEMIGRFTEGMQAEGRGRLALKLALPLRTLKDSRVAGSYQFVDNRLRVEPNLPPLEQVNGRLEFTENAVRGTGIAAQLFGGAASISVATQGGAVVVGANGRANLDQLRAPNAPWLGALSGSTDWRSTITVRGKQADFALESSTLGIVSTLPAPLAKAASEEMPLRVQRQVKTAQADQIDWTWGHLIAGSLVRRREGPNLLVDRIALGLGTEPPSAESAGIWLRGDLRALDVDRWRSLWRKAGTGEGALPPLAGFDLRVAALDVFGRRLNDFSMQGRGQAGGWQTTVASRELSGELAWQPQGKGRLTARFAKLALPPALERADTAAASGAESPSDYPAVDLVAEEFQHKAKALGRLELAAVPEGRDWRIERLQLRNADGNFTADGRWQWQERTPRTQLNVHLDVNDMGKLLVRLGYPEGIRGSNARLSGALSWSGAPQDLDLPTLSGHLAIAAGRGQFLKLDPGIGKLLSILSLQALPRRVALDFKDVFSDGFTFDEIEGVLKLERGVGTTEGFRINGAAAKVSMSGEVDFANETQKLRVRVTPQLGDSVSTVTALLGGPVAGIGVYLAQKLLNDPLGQLVAYDYDVAGTWSEPQVTKIQVERVRPELD